MFLTDMFIDTSSEITHYFPLSQAQTTFNGGFQPPICWEPFVAATMLHWPEPGEKSQTNDPQHNNNRVPCSTRLTFLLLLWIQHGMWHNHHITAYYCTSHMFLKFIYMFVLVQCELIKHMQSTG